MPDTVPAGFADLFASRYVPYADADVVGTLAMPDPALVHRVHLIAQPGEGQVTVCESAEGWRFLPGGRLEPGEDLDTAVRRELLEEAGSAPIGPVLFFFSEVASSRAARPYLAHVPHPVSWWTFGACRSRVFGPPTSPADGEQIVAVHHLPVAAAINWLAVRDSVHADVVRLAMRLGLLVS